MNPKTTFNLRRHRKALRCLTLGAVLILSSSTAMAGSKYHHRKPTSCVIPELSELRVQKGPLKGASYSNLLSWISAPMEFNRSIHRQKLVQQALMQLSKKRQLLVQNAPGCQKKYTQIMR